MKFMKFIGASSVCASLEDVRARIREGGGNRCEREHPLAEAADPHFSYSKRRVSAYIYQVAIS
jgi:hypothetical protein